MISRALKDCKCDVSASWAGKSANAKSVADLLLLEAPQGSVLSLAFKGKGAERCRERAATIAGDELEVTWATR